MTVKNCGGNCCVAFQIGWTHEEFEFLCWSVRVTLRLIDIDPTDEVCLDFWLHQNTYLHGGEKNKIYDFEDCRKMMLGFIPFTELKTDKKTFTCRVWNKETRLCNEYENRPIICRNHGVKSKCAWIGCKL